MKITLILCDSLRYDRVTPEIMPSVSRCADNGVRYTMYWGPGGQTRDAMPYLLCGEKQYAKATSFPHKLEKNGYSTSIVHTNAILAADKYQEAFGEYLDVDSAYAPELTRTRRLMKKLRIWGLTRSLRRRMRSQPINPQKPYRHAESVLNDARKALDLDPDFLWVHLMDPHIPYSPPGLNKMELLETRKIYDKIIESVRGKEGLTKAETARAAYFYNKECTYMDAQIGRFVGDHPERLHFITSDHGDMFGENYTYTHSPRWHGVTPQLGHLPLIVFGPEVTPSVVTRYNCSINIGATITDLFGLGERHGYGCSFKGDLLG